MKISVRNSVFAVLLFVVGMLSTVAHAVRWEPREPVAACTMQGICTGDSAIVTVQGCTFIKNGEARVFNFLAYWDAQGEHRLSLPVVMIPSQKLDVGQGGSGFNVGWQDVSTGDEIWFRIDRGTWTDATPDSGARIAGLSAVAKNGTAPNGQSATWIDPVLTVSCGN